MSDQVLMLLVSAIVALWAAAGWLVRRIMTDSAAAAAAAAHAATAAIAVTTATSATIALAAAEAQKTLVEHMNKSLFECATERQEARASAEKKDAATLLMLAGILETLSRIEAKGKAA